MKINDAEEKAEVGIRLSQLLKRTHLFIQSMQGLIEFSGSKNLILKDDDIFCILEIDDIEDIKPSNDISLRWKVEAISNEEWC